MLEREGERETEFLNKMIVENLTICIYLISIANFPTFPSTARAEMSQFIIIIIFVG